MADSKSEGEAVKPDVAADVNGHDAENAAESQAVDETTDELAYDGNLPDFSDDESGGGADSSAVRKPTAVPRPVGAPSAKKGRLPLSALNKLKKSSSKAASGPSAASGTTPKVEPADKGKVVTENQLERLMAQLAMDGATATHDGIQTDDLRQLMRSIGLNKEYLQGKKGLMGKGTKDMASHKFWATQPVPKLGTSLDQVKEGAIEGNKAPEEISKEPVTLHKDFKWVTIDVTDQSQRKEVQDLLTNHYVEDEDASFRLDYSSEFLDWALKPPGWVADWHIGIRVAESNKLVAFIAGIPIDLRVRSVTKRCVEINFLCVHKKLRSKRLAPLMIKEVTRRCHLKGIFQAIYTAGVFLPTPVSRCQYFHRSLNPRKLVETGFSAMPRNQTMFRMQNYYKVPDETTIPGLREIEKRDLKQASRLIRAYLARMDMAPAFSNKDVEHTLWSGRGQDLANDAGASSSATAAKKRKGQVVWTYVVEDPETKQITDVFSFYSLPSTAVKSKPMTHINAAYLFYYATTACSTCANLGDGSQATPITNWHDESPEERQKLKERLNLLVSNALILAHKAGFDVFNALTLQDNALFLEEQKFGRGDGFLHYYLYNYQTKPIAGGIDTAEGGSGVGVVML